MKIDVLGATPNPASMITWAARFSTRSHDKTSQRADRKLLRKLYERGHWSTFEFNRWTVHLVGVDPVELLHVLSDVKGWELTVLSTVLGEDRVVLSGNIRTLMEGRGYPLCVDIAGGLAQYDPTWLWVHDLVSDGVLMEDAISFEGDFDYDGYIYMIPRVKSAEEQAKHAAAVFVFRGISRSCANQLTRHRLCSFIQESLRYVEPEDVGFVMPQSIVERKMDFGMPLEDPTFSWIKDIFELYDVLRDYAVPKEDARYVLPLGTKTTVVAMASLREWAHIIRLRTNPSAQWEIRGRMETVRDVLRENIPWFEEVLNV